MKTLLTVLILSSIVTSCNGASEQTKSEVSAPAAAKTSAPQGILPGDVKEEDCDDKAKKPIEIKEETISLSGNTGCTLDEAAAKP